MAYTHFNGPFGTYTMVGNESPGKIAINSLNFFDLNTLTQMLLFLVFPRLKELGKDENCLRLVNVF